MSITLVDTTQVNTASTARGQHLDYLDGWRGVAITLLLIGHFFPVPGINLGRLGVEFFFVLSGFLMTGLLFIKKVPILLFYQRRIARIFPAMYVFLLANILFFFVSGKSIEWSEVLTAAFFLNNYLPGEIGNNHMPFGHIWSLSVEEHTYVFLTILALVCRTHRFAAIRLFGFVSAAMVVIGSGYWLRISAGVWPHSIWQHTEIAAYGILISGSLLLFYRGRSIPKLSVLTLVVLTCSVVILQWWSVPPPITMYIGTGVLALLLNLLSSAPPFLKALLSIAPFRYLGLWSYSLYLWQQPFYLAHHRNGLPAALALGLALLAGIFSYYFVERPARQYLNSKWKPSNVCLSPSTEKKPDSGRT